ncbi:MAG: hypothetical protein CMH62_03265 [Nanoarchaeota archaeon]|nr:hypothetical protein [Nanoarchaeota archaeon]
MDKSLIIIPADYFRGELQTGWASLWAEWLPIGPLSVASNNSHNTMVIDEAITPDYIDYNNFSDDIEDIGFWVSIGNYQTVLERSRLIRESAPWVRIGWGGPYCHIMWKKMIERPEVDWICYGYGEEAWERVLKEGLNKDIPNIVYTEEGELIVTHQKLRDLRTLKKPNFDLLPDLEIRKKYFMEEEEHCGVGIPGVDYEGWQILSMISADGCPVGPQGRCTFCTRGEEAYIVHGAEVYAKNIKEYIEKYGKIIISEICDDFMNRGFLRNLDKELTKQNVPRDKFYIDFCFGSVGFLTIRDRKKKKEFIELLKALNIRRVFIGYEHRVQEQLDIVKGGINLEQQDEATDLLLEAGIAIDAAFLLSVPGETELTMEIVYNYAKELKNKGGDKIRIRRQVLILIPPSALWQKGLKDPQFKEKFGDTALLDIWELTKATIELFYEGKNKPGEVYKYFNKLEELN